MTKKFLSVLLVLVLSFATFGCSKLMGGDEDEAIDYDRTQLYVSNFDGGYGHEWLQKAKERFETFYAETSFEEGKTGVQIIIENAKNTGSKWLDLLKTDRNQVIFTESVYYNDFVSTGKILDITDVVTGSLSTYGENKTILSKLSDLQESALNVNGKYYAVPHYEGYNGITIDVDLFDTKNLFLNEDGEFECKSTSNGLSAGPDGVTGTYDDGLPATFEEFFELCEVMSDRGCDPMTWSGQYAFYMNNLAMAIAADVNGYDETKLTVTFNGTSNKIVTGLDNNGNYTLGTKEIKSANGYEIMGTEGYYQAIDFINTLVNEHYYSNDSFTSTYSHTDAQDKFLLSSIASNITPIGMISEGCWWVNEAKGTFSDMVQQYGEDYSKANRRLKFMPFPKAKEEYVGEGNTMAESVLSYMFINAYTAEKYIPLAKEFVKFVNTDESLREFTTLTETPKGLNYNLTEEDMNKLSYYGKSLLQVKEDPNTKIVYQISDNRLFSDNISKLKFTERLWSKVGTKTYQYPSTAFKNDGSLSSKAYFEGFKAYWQGEWSKFN